MRRGPLDHLWSAHPSPQEVLATIPGLKPSGSGFSGRCILEGHEDRNPSMVIAFAHDGKPLVHCFGGCDQKALFRRFCEIVCSGIRARSSGGEGRWARKRREYEETKAAIHAVRSEIHPASPVQLDRKAVQMFRATRSVENSSIAAAYFESRYLKWRPSLDDVVRFAPWLKHHPTQSHYPALILKVEPPSGELIGVHRLYLAPDGRGKAEVSPNKMMFGDLADGSVHLDEAGPTLIVGEGFETTLSAMQMKGLPGYAALSASRLPRVALPDVVRELIILVDNDLSGTGERCARAAAERFATGGRKAWLWRPPAEYKDFNDVLTGKRR